MAISFTPEQQQVIQTQGHNILVSAAAGSGKTAVLVERIVQMISEGEHPLDIDKLLVVTFTNAAATQMRERISLAISKKLETEPDNAHLQRQATLIHNAQITTIDSFCLFIIRNNFNDIALDPAFRVMDEGELNLLKKDVMQQVLEEYYEKGGEDFLFMVDYFSTGSGDRNLEEYIGNLYRFAISHPWPEEWLLARKRDYQIHTVEELNQSDWVLMLCVRVRETLQELTDILLQCKQICEQPDGPYMYGELLEQETTMLRRVAEHTTLEELYQAWETIVFGRLPGKKDDSVAPFKRTMIQNMRKGVKDEISDLYQKYFRLSPEKTAVRMGTVSRAVNSLIDVTLTFKKQLDDRKRKENMIDFSDMEHLALAILLQKEGDTYRATETARDYRRHFAEILIDEYQDSNMVQELLLQSISGEEEGQFNRFMVGDVKQSIYKFRLARPEIFMEKFDRYQPNAELEQRIDLHKNFRSRKEILEGINFIFSQIMGRDLGGVAYDEKARLNPGAAYASIEEKNSGETDLPVDSAVECLLLMKPQEEESGLDNREKEALMIADRIKELVGHFPVTDEETGQLRPAAYGDIVILLRSNTGWDEDFGRILRAEGIPTYATSKTGYFQAMEVQTVLQVLRVLDNPRQDIPLYGVMKSFFGGFTEEEIAKLTSLDTQKQELIDRVRAHAGDERIDSFLAWMELFRRKTAYTPIHDLLRELIIDSGYLQFVTALPGGAQRRANVEMLMTRAVSFEQTSFHGLFRFVRYIEQLEKYDADYGEANILDDHADVVRLMSIHKSKGLEFPICFVAGLAKRFNMQDSNSRLIADVDMGIGADYVDAVNRIQSKTLRKNVVADKMRRDNIGEELRVLYVAMTRAKEKLILTGLLPAIDAVTTKYAVISNEEQELLPPRYRSGAASYLEFLLSALVRHPEFVKLWEKGSCEQEQSVVFTDAPAIHIRLQEIENLVKNQVKEVITRAGSKQKLRLTNGDNELMTAIAERFATTYPFPYLSELYAKTTVSELKKAAMEESEFTAHLFEEQEVTPYIPAFVHQESLSGTARGSAYHRVMELLNYQRLYQITGAEKTKLQEKPWQESQQNRPQELEQEVRLQIDRQKMDGRLTAEYAEAVRMDKVMAFLDTPLARRMMKAASQGKLYKEQPFVLGLPASLLREDFPHTETVLIQGIIDVFFEENGELVVADYKTDVVRESEELLLRYRTQLEYYAEALEQMTEKKVKEKIIYSFALNQEVLV